jgi:hypothetical protein
VYTTKVIQNISIKKSVGGSKSTVGNQVFRSMILDRLLAGNTQIVIFVLNYTTAPAMEPRADNGSLRLTHDPYDPMNT